MSRSPITTSAVEVTASACGKVLLCGEHAVVHGQPAIAIGLPDGATATARLDDTLAGPLLRAPAWNLAVRPGHDDADEPLARALGALLDAMQLDRDLPVEVTLELALPVGVGLGSSAALGIAAARAVADLVEQRVSVDDLVELGYAWEGVFHGTPSGIDHTAAARGGVFVFQRRPQAPPAIDQLTLAEPLELVVAVAGPASSTRDMVAAVTERVRTRDDARQAVDEIGDIVRRCRTLLGQNDSAPELGRLLDRNHTLLDILGVNTPALEAACQRARQAGALGAKVTGAGGGGCIVALAASADQAASITEALRSQCSEVLCRTVL